MEKNSAITERKTLISIRNLKQYFPVKGKRDTYVKANDGVSLDIYEGETVGIVGESGCGKSTLGRSLLQLYKQTDGETIYYGNSTEEIVPFYVLKIFRNIEKKCRQTKEAMAYSLKLDEEYAALEKKYGDTTDVAQKMELYVKLNIKNEVKKRAMSEYLAMVRLIGGFYVANPNDYPAIKNALVNYFYAAKKVRNMRRKIDALRLKMDEALFEIEHETKRADKAKYEKLKNNIESLEKNELAALEAERGRLQAAIDEVRKPYANNEQFQKYENMRDDGIDLSRLRYNEIRHLRQDMQLIFQDPYSSLNPRLTVGQIVSEGPLTHGHFADTNDRLQEYAMKIMEDCGLAPYMIHRYPHQFSGGQRQRIGIARALSVKPKFVVCDEAVSALDVSIQSQIINLLQDLKEKENLAYMFISHDLSVVKYISDRIAVMYLGNIVELTDTRRLFEKPLHPYTEALLSAIPTTDAGGKKEMILLEGDIPSPVNPPKGCKFNTRCRDCMDICLQVVPDLVELTPGHFVACHKYDK